MRGEAELSMLFVDEQAMTDLNKRFLGKEGPTDVLAFPIDDEPIEGGRSPDSGGTGPGFTTEPSDLPTVLGDVVICPAVAFRNAPEHAGTYDDELALLIVHGVLHLLGMDHDDDDEAEAMEQRERQLLAKLYQGARRRRGTALREAGGQLVRAAAPRSVRERSVPVPPAPRGAARPDRRPTAHWGPSRRDRGASRHPRAADRPISGCWSWCSSSSSSRASSPCPRPA